MELPLAMKISEQAHQAGKQIAASTDENMAEILNEALGEFLGENFKSTPTKLFDLSEAQSSTFTSVIYRSNGGIGEDVHSAIPADAAAAVVEGCAEMTVEGLQEAYGRIAAAKRLKKTPIERGQTRTNITLGIIMAARSAVPVESLIEELARLNVGTPSECWPDMIVIADTAVINYAVQFPGESLSGDFLPPAENAMVGGTPAFYVVMVARPTGTHAFNKMLAFLFVHLGIFMPGAKLPDWAPLLEGVTQHVVTHTGYQYDLGGKIAPVPREFYSDRLMPSRPLLIVGPDDEVLSTIEFLPWQDGGTILLRGNLPLEGILVFFGKTGVERSRVIRRDEVQISYVLPINEADFGEMLQRFQRQSNMTIRRDAGGFVVQKIADEGTSTPFMARMMLGILILRNAVYAAGPERDEFDRLYDAVTSSLFNARTSSQDISQTWKEHARKIVSGESAELRGGNIHIAESIDRELRRDVESVLNATARTMKTALQQLAGLMGMDIGFLFRKQSAFEAGITAFEKKDAPLAAYLRETRGWTEPLMLLRNDLEYAIWALPLVAYARVGESVRAEEPAVADVTVSEFVAAAFDRLSCLVEELTAHGLQRWMPAGITITEIPPVARNAEAPERFRVTLLVGGLPAWAITYHASRFEDV